MAHLLRKVNFTYEYDSFSLLPDRINRKVEKPHVKTIAHSIKILGSLRAVIAARLTFLDKNKLYVIDGQHLIESSRERDEEVAWIEINITSKKQLIKAISLLNSSAKTWKLHDYVHAWAWLINDYKALWQAYMDNNIPLSAVICAYSLIETREPQPVKDGDFKITDMNRGDLIVGYLSELYQIIPRGNRSIARMFTEQYCWMMYNSNRGYNHESFKKYVEQRGNTMFFLPEQKEKWQQFLLSWKEYKPKQVKRA